MTHYLNFELRNGSNERHYIGEDRDPDEELRRFLNGGGERYTGWIACGPDDDRYVKATEIITVTLLEEHDPLVG